MVSIGTPNTPSSTKLMLLGSGELGKEIAIEAQRFGLEVIAIDRYKNATAMQIAHKYYVIPMTDAKALEAVIRKKPVVSLGKSIFELLPSKMFKTCHNLYELPNSIFNMSN